LLVAGGFALGASLINAEAAQFPLAPYGEIRRWRAELGTLPAWQRTLATTMSPLAAAA
jgi:hypothetical protein